MSHRTRYGTVEWVSVHFDGDKTVTIRRLSGDDGDGVLATLEGEF